MNKKLILAAVVLAVLVLGGVLWWRHAHRADDGDLVFNGNVDIRQISLAFDNSGRVLSVGAEEGDTVKAGTVLATLDTQALQFQADQAQAQIQVQAQALLKARNGSRPEEITQARNHATAAQADAEQASADLARLEDVAARTSGRGVSAKDLDAARAKAKAAQATAQAQREALRLSELGPRQEDRDSAQAQLDAAQASLKLLQYQIAQGELRAPADAVVRSRLLEPGDMASAQKPVFALALTHPKWVRIYVGETDLGRVKPGMAARVTTDSHPDTAIAGKVGYIASVAEFTPKSVQTEALRTSLVYEVRVLVQDTDNALRLGQPATVTLVTDAGPRP